MPIPSTYDATLIFCEGAIEIGERVFDFSVHGVEVRDFTGIDIRLLAGLNTVYTIFIPVLKADKSIKILLKKRSDKREPFISGFIISPPKGLLQLC